MSTETLVLLIFGSVLSAGIALLIKRADATFTTVTRLEERSATQDERLTEAEDGLHKLRNRVIGIEGDVSLTKERVAELQRRVK